MDAQSTLYAAECAIRLRLCHTGGTCLYTAGTNAIRGQIVHDRTENTVYPLNQGSALRLGLELVLGRELGLG